ncbi:hypothetical protein PENTCL1PPCAC_1561, partial [Pristionchus entomophagus]
KSDQMCSFITQIEFGILMLTTFVLTIGGIFSKNWVQTESVHKGLFCDVYTMLESKEQRNIFCPDWWNNLKLYERAVVGCLFFAIVIQILALAWNLVTFFACCCKEYVIHPLSAISFLNVLCLTGAVVIFAINSSDAIGDLQYEMTAVFGGKHGYLGQSFILECVALGIALLCTIISPMIL